MAKTKPKVCVVAACDQNGVIGVDGGIPWHCPEDLRHFRWLTMGRVVLMGRKTADSLPKPLRDRINVVLTRDAAYHRDGFLTITKIAQIHKILKKYEQDQVWIIGGQDLYEKYTPQADVVHLTVLQTSVDITQYDPNTVRYFPMNLLKNHQGIYNQSSKDPAVVFWTLTRPPIPSARNAPSDAMML